MATKEPFMQSVSNLSPAQFAKYFDHTLLSPSALSSDYETLCREAKEHNFFSVCVPTNRLALCRPLLSGSEVKLCTVVGFPLGYSSTASKADETKAAIQLGAEEIDMVLPINELIDGNLAAVEADVKSVVGAAQSHLVKVILETCYLNESQIIEACKISEAAGAQYVKTSTGFGSAGATVEHIALMRKTVGDHMGVKASGGIRDFAVAEKMIAAGATRIGASKSVEILKGLS